MGQNSAERLIRRLSVASLFAIWLGLGAAAPTSAFAAPANDNFAAARPLGSSAQGSVIGSNVDATKETGEPDHAGNAGGHSVWYSWTAPANGNAFFTTRGSAFDTLLAVYTGVAVGSLTSVASNDDDPGLTFEEVLGASTVSFAVSGGVTYMLAVDSFSGKVGSLTLRWGRAPANDNFANARALPGASEGSASGSVRGATLEPGEPPPFFGRTVWYSWTAPANGTFKFDTFDNRARGGSNFDTVLAVYVGSGFDLLTRVGLNDDDPDRGCCSSWVPIRGATAGTTYSISVASFEGSCRNCNFVLNWSPLILGGPAAETLVGTMGNEEIRGRGGADTLRGGAGNDSLFGGPGDDLERGGPGNDVIFDRRGVDQLFGQAGNDHLDARDFHRVPDLLSGGLDTDTCTGDRRDIRRGCP